LKCNNQLKKFENFFFNKTQNNGLFISPKWKNAILEMSLKSFIMSKLDQEMSSIWIQVAQIWHAEKLSTWLLSSGQEFDEKFLDSKHVLKPSRKNKDFIFLPVPILPGWLKIY
jgi:hypothetical protein